MIILSKVAGSCKYVFQNKTGSPDIICPLIEESERFDVQAAVELEKELSSGVFFRECRVAILHGRLKTEEKEKVMKSFYNGVDC